MSRPLISCLLITFNQEQFVAEALQSVLAQSYSPLEILVSDDASSDGTYPLLERLVAAYQGPHRLALRRNAVRRNVVGHIEDAISHTNGELIVLAAGDDVSLPNRVEQVVTAWEATNRRVHALNSNVQQFDEFGYRSIVAGCGGRDKLTMDDFTNRSAPFIGASGVFSRAVFERFGRLDPFNIFEDQVLPFRALLLGGILSLDEVLVLWRRSWQSNSVKYLHGPSSAKARLARLIYQQQQIACYEAQRVADIDHLQQHGEVLPPSITEVRAKLQGFAKTAEIAAVALQQPSPATALAREVLQGGLRPKAALKFMALYRAPQLSDWWFKLRTFGAKPG